MRKFTPVNNEIYHIFNRGTEKRSIFLNQKDYERFLVNLIFFNTQQKPTNNLSRYNLELAYQKIPKDPLVKIHAFSLLPNHFYMIVEQLVDGGLSRFLHKSEMGYSQYFNKFHSRSGNLFQGAYKIIHIDNDSYRLYLPLYIHLNALELLDSEKDWKEKGIKNKTNAINFLKNYKWSSLIEYLKIQPMPFITRDILDELYKNPEEWESALKDWLPQDQCAPPSG
jgi:putative transposase